MDALFHKKEGEFTYKLKHPTKEITEVKFANIENIELIDLVMNDGVSFIDKYTAMSELEFNSLNQVDKSLMLEIVNDYTSFLLNLSEASESNSYKTKHSKEVVEISIKNIDDVDVRDINSDMAIDDRIVSFTNLELKELKDISNFDLFNIFLTIGNKLNKFKSEKEEHIKEILGNQ